ncbi:hypothetical protein TTRE_0000376001 [Trichuris trichiura]|uniref:Uncharacterized protein n=1 Tax=Trichuris trichiura TaxID=36087 RepID=A0A077Z769_TRITR|nr:hypothetical protein TTRE_0000376001 [Trichuris trichiura]
MSDRFILVPGVDSVARVKAPWCDQQCSNVLERARLLHSSLEEVCTSKGQVRFHLPYLYLMECTAAPNFVPTVTILDASSASCSHSVRPIAPPSKSGSGSHHRNLFNCSSKGKRASRLRCKPV